MSEVSHVEHILAPYQPMAKIPRFHSAVVVTEKIDGTNACIEVAPFAVSAGSRNRRLVTIQWGPFSEEHPEVQWHEQDNYGFGKWVVCNYQRLRRLGYGRHFGEWYGQGIQRTYGLDHKRLALFREPKGGLPEGLPENVHVVPELFRGDYRPPYTAFDEDPVWSARSDLRIYGSKAVPGWIKPEGIVVFHERGGNLYKWPFDPNPKGSHASD